MNQKFTLYKFSGFDTHIEQFSDRYQLQINGWKNTYMIFKKKLKKKYPTLVNINILKTEKYEIEQK